MTSLKHMSWMEILSADVCIAISFLFFFFIFYFFFFYNLNFMTKLITIFNKQAKLLVSQ